MFLTMSCCGCLDFATIRLVCDPIERKNGLESLLDAAAISSLSYVAPFADGCSSSWKSWVRRVLSPA